MCEPAKMDVQPAECTRCGEMCEATIHYRCAECNDGSQVYWWPCRACGNTVNGSQCERKENCVNAIAYRREHGI